MKYRCFTVILLVLALLVAVPVAAQAPQPPIDHPVLTDDQRPVPLPDRPTDATESMTSPGVDLGQPGTVFRYVQTFGVTEQAYLADVQHLNRPAGVFIDGTNNLFVVEEWGARMLKYRTSDGANLLSIGTAGLEVRGSMTLDHPVDVATDSGGNVWVVDRHRMAQYSPAGAFLQEFPPDDPWNSGNDNSHFNEPRGVAFDSQGRMYVSDRYNHRVQVYTFAGGAPVYQSTIGVTGVSGSDAAHFNEPTQIVIDSSNRLYVSDLQNFRVQRCTYAASWSCTTFHGTGNDGGGANELSWAFGLGIDGNGSHVYIADSNNGRVKKCDTNGNCSILVSGLSGPNHWPADVAVDTAGIVYIADWKEFTVRKYSSGGSFLGTFSGTSGVPYLTDNSHFNQPIGVAVDPTGNVYVSTERGFRLLKVNKSGVPQWSVGTPGVYGSDNAHFGDTWGGPGDVAVGPNGNVLVADAPNHRVQIFNSQGAYVTTLGSYGMGNYQFDWPRGVAVDSSGNIYVADCANHRVQIYNSSRVYLATIGATGNPGSSNNQFRCPHGLTVDSQGNLYVADIDNARVQIFDNQRNYVRTVGVTGQQGDDFGHLSGPASVAVDGQGRLYVADAWNERVQVFDPTGAYLTTIGGQYGSATGQSRNMVAVDVDAQGNVFIADSRNHRIQKFAPGLPGWRQVNINGFGDRENFAVWSLGAFEGKLYASSANYASGAEVYRLSSSGAWDLVATGGFGDASNIGIDRLTEFNGQLYASTWAEYGSGAQIWRSPSGNAGSWGQVAQGGLGSTNNSEFMTLTPFNGYLYAGSWVEDPAVGGAEIWRSNTGNSGSWTRMVSNGFDSGNDAILTMKVFDGYLYAGTGPISTGGQVWRTSDGVNWLQVNAGGFGSAENSRMVSLEVFGGKLYAGTSNSSTGGEIWRTSNGTSWERVLQGGFGSVDNRYMAGLIPFRGELFVLAGNSVTGPEVWHSPTGDSGSWRKVIDSGFGAGNSLRAAWDNHATVFDGSLYIGTYTFGNGGGRLWKYLHNRNYLPALLAQ